MSSSKPRSARRYDAEWIKNILKEFYRSKNFPIKGCDVPYTEDNFDRFQECFIATKAIEYQSTKSKTYNEDLVSDLKNDPYLVALKAWLRNSGIDTLFVITPTPRPVPALTVPRPPGPVAGRSGFGPAVGYDGRIPLPPPDLFRNQSAFHGGGVSVERFQEEERKVAKLRNQNDSVGAELHNAQDKIHEMERALQLAAQREAQRNAADREAQRMAAVKEAERVAAVRESQLKAAEQAKSDAEKAEILADKEALQKRIDAFKKRAREPDTDPLPAPKHAKSGTDHATIMCAFGATFGAVAMGFAISPAIPAALTAAALTLVVKAKVDAAKKK